MTACTTLAASSAADGSAKNPYVLTTGITFNLVNRIKRADGSPFDLNSPSRTGRAEMRVHNVDVGTPVATFTVTNSVTETGRADVELGATASENIAESLYVFDVEYENDIDATDVIPGGGGFIRVVVGVTKS